MIISCICKKQTNKQTKAPQPFLRSNQCKVKVGFLVGNMHTYTETPRPISRRTVASLSVQKGSKLQWHDSRTEEKQQNHRTQSDDSGGNKPHLSFLFIVQQQVSSEQNQPGAAGSKHRLIQKFNKLLPTIRNYYQQSSSPICLVSLAKPPKKPKTS